MRYGAFKASLTKNFSSSFVKFLCHSWQLFSGKTGESVTKPNFFLVSLRYPLLANKVKMQTNMNGIELEVKTLVPQKANI